MFGSHNEHRSGIFAMVYDTARGHRDNYHGYTRKAHAAWWAGSTMSRLTWKTSRALLWGWRRTTGPLAVAWCCWWTTLWLHLSPGAWTAPLVVGVGAAPLVYHRLGLPAGRFTRRAGQLPSRARRLWFAAGYLLTWMWTVLAAALGPLNRPRTSLLIVGAAVFWAARWHHTRVRAEDVPDVSEIEATWARVRGTDGTALVGVERLTDPVRVAATVDLTDSHLLTSKIGELVPEVAKRFAVPVHSVMLDYTGQRLEHLAALEVVYENLCYDPVLYDDTWIPTMAEIAAGYVPLVLYPNGDRGYLRYAYPGQDGDSAGGVFTIFTGDPGAGKSAAMTAAAIQLMFTGRAYLVAACPQNGASFPSLAGADGVAAWKAACSPDGPTGLDPILAVLDWVKDVLDDRSERMSRFRWQDSYGDWHTGLESFDYELVAKFAAVNETEPWPWIVVLLDELWRYMALPEYAAIVKELLKLARKVGIILFGATQYPALQEFGDDESIRQPLKAGNSLCFRNSAHAAGSMILDPGMPSPNSIPEFTPDRQHTKGSAVAQMKGPNSARATVARAAWAKRSGHYAKKAAERMHPLEPEAQALRNEYLPPGTNVAPARTREPEPATPGTPAAAGGRAGRTYVIDQIVAYLATREDVDFRCSSKKIAQELDRPHSTVSSALGRAAKRAGAQVVDYGNGEWGLAEAARPRELAGAAA